MLNKIMVFLFILSASKSLARDQASFNEEGWAMVPFSNEFLCLAAEFHSNGNVPDGTVSLYAADRKSRECSDISATQFWEIESTEHLEQSIQLLTLFRKWIMGQKDNKYKGVEKFARCFLRDQGSLIMGVRWIRLNNLKYALFESEKCGVAGLWINKDKNGNHQFLISPKLYPDDY